MAKLSKNSKLVRGETKRRRKRKHGRPLKPKDNSYFEEDSLFRKEVVDIITAYLVFT